MMHVFISLIACILRGIIPEIIFCVRILACMQIDIYPHQIRGSCAQKQVQLVVCSQRTKL
jgi:hypothetical protein